MKITFDRTKKQLELIKAMASRNREEAYAAQLALAEFMGPLVSQVINQAPVISNLFTSFPFDPDSNPSLPLDLYYDITDEDYITIYSQSLAGGLPTNEVRPTQSELKFQTYDIDSAVAFDRRYAQRSRLDVVAKSFTRLAQEVLIKQERTSANLMLGTLADNSNATSLSRLIAGTSTRLLPADFNNLLVRAARVNSSWYKGTPEGRVGGITDMLLSPERMAVLRAMAYNPVNVLEQDGTASSGADAGLSAPDVMRMSLYSGAGLASFYGIKLQQIHELGIGQRYTTVFDNLYTGTFTIASDDLVLGLDLSRESMLRAVSTDPDSNSEVNLQVDDQFVARQKKIGWYLEMEEGRMVIDNRAIFGIRIASATS